MTELHQEARLYLPWRHKANKHSFNSEDLQFSVSEMPLRGQSLQWECPNWRCCTLFSQGVSKPDQQLKQLCLIKSYFVVKQTHPSRHAGDNSYLLEMEGTQVPLESAWFSNRYFPQWTARHVKLASDVNSWRQMIINFSELHLSVWKYLLPVMGTARTATNLKCINVSAAMRIIKQNDLKMKAKQLL